VEEFVSKAIRKILKNQAVTALTVHKLAADGIALDSAQRSLQDVDQIWEALHFQEKQRITKQLIQNVVVDNTGVKILLNHEGIHELIREVTK
jgi:hypothetical protein